MLSSVTPGALGSAATVDPPVVPPVLPESPLDLHAPRSSNIDTAVNARIFRTGPPRFRHPGADVAKVCITFISMQGTGIGADRSSDQGVGRRDPTEPAR